MFSSTNKNSFTLAFLLLVTSCTPKGGFYQESVEPSHWHTSLSRGVTDEQIHCQWWQSLNDCQLNQLIEQVVVRNNDIQIARKQSAEKSLETVNAIIADTAKTYLELRAWQQRLRMIEESIEIQNKIIVLEDSLMEYSLSLLEQNENKKSLNALIIQKSQADLTIKRLIFHLSTLLGNIPGELCISEHGDLPKLPCNIPVGCPVGLVERHPSVQEAKKLYLTTFNEQAFFHYQKTLLDVLEQAENALAAFLYSLEKMEHLENSKTLKKETYHLLKDQYEQGFKNERELLTTKHELLAQEILSNEAKTEALTNFVNLYHSFRGLCLGDSVP